MMIPPSERFESSFSRDWLSSIPRLGVGLSYREPFRKDLFRHQPSIDFLELVADHFFKPSPQRERLLEQIGERFTLIPHGLSLSLGSADGLDEEYLQLFATLLQLIKPPYWSEHIAFTKAGGLDIGHLTPVPRTRETLRVLQDNIRRAQDVLGCPLILENITESIRFPSAEMDDAEFLTEVCEQNDCGLLLDVTNLYINSINHRYDPLRVLWKLPPERIVQLHFAGGHWEDGELIDSHSTKAPEEVWHLLAEVVKYAPVRGIILERDECLPPLAELLPELHRARACWSEVYGEPY